MASAAVVIVSRSEDKRGETGVGSGKGLCFSALASRVLLYGMRAGGMPMHSHVPVRLSGAEHRRRGGNSVQQFAGARPSGGCRRRGSREGSRRCALRCVHAPAAQSAFARAGTLQVVGAIS